MLIKCCSTLVTRFNSLTVKAYLSTMKVKKKKVSLSSLQKKADKVFNKFVRDRDSKDGFFTCISCNRTLEVKQMNAGHYVAKKNCLGLRYNEFNCSGECAYCNCFNESHLIGYRENLVIKYGLEKVLELEQARHNTVKFGVLDYLEIIEKYK
jgi:hypothetical protein